MSFISLLFWLDGQVEGINLRLFYSLGFVVGALLHGLKLGGGWAVGSSLGIIGVLNLLGLGVYSSRILGGLGVGNSDLGLTILIVFESHIIFK